MERVGDLNNIGEHRVEHAAVAVGQVEGSPLDAIPPCLGLFGEPTARPDSAATRHNVKELTASHVNNLGGPTLGPERSNIDEGRSAAGLSTADREDLVKLRRELKVAKLENEILKRAAAYFALGNVLPK